MITTGIECTNVREAYQKYIDGDTLTVSDLRDLHIHMRLLRRLLAPLGDRFQLQFDEAMRVMEQTESYLDTRREEGLRKRDNYVPMLDDEKDDYRRLKPL